MVMTEYCCEEDSALGKTGPQYGIEVVRLTKREDGRSQETQEKIERIIEEEEEGVLMGFIPCTYVCKSSNLNMKRGSEETQEKIQEGREVTKEMVKNFTENAGNIQERGGAIIFEWPDHIMGWQMEAIKEPEERMQFKRGYIPWMLCWTKGPGNSKTNVGTMEVHDKRR